MAYYWLFLAQFAHFSIRTETEVTVHTHSQTNRHLHLWPARSSSGLWKPGFVGAQMLEGPDQSLTWPGQRLSQWPNCACRAWCSRLRKVNLPPWPTMVYGVCAPHISSKGPQLQFDRHVQTGFQNKISFHRTLRRTRKKKTLSVPQSLPLQTSCWQFRVVCHAFFHTPNLCNRGWSLPSDCSNFEGEKTSALCTLNFYDVQCTPAKRRSPWGNPENRGNPIESANQQARYF